MTITDSTYDVVVIGAGITGCIAARELAPDHDVLVLDKDQIAGSTTSKASGLISIIHDYEDHPDAARYAIDFFEEFDGTGNFDYTRRNSVDLVEPERVENARTQASKMVENGFDVSYLGKQEIRNRYPGMFSLDGFEGAVEYREGGWVDPYTLTMAIKNDAEDNGADFETNVEVQEIRTDEGSVEGVTTSEGSVSASTVVVGAGWKTREIVSDFFDMPIRPFRYQTVNIETPREFEDDYPIAWETLTNIYWRPEHNGDLHVGGGTYFVENEGNIRTNESEEFRRLIASVITDRVAGLTEPRIVSGDTCPIGDAATPDGYPIVDTPQEGPDGLVVGTGMHGFGIMAAPTTGAAIRSLVTDEEPPFSMEEFSLGRFDDRSTDFGSSYIVEPDESLPSPK